MYPNPVVDWLQTKLPTAAKSGEIVQLLDAQGRQLSQVTHEENATSASLDLSYLPTGTYVVKLRNASKIIFKR